MIRYEEIVITAGTSVANAAGTVTSTRPIVGEVVQVRNAGTALGGTCDYTLTRIRDGGTVWDELNVAGPFSRQPRLPVHSTAGAASLYASAGEAVLDMAGVPCADHLQLVIGSAVASATGTLTVYYRA